MFIANDKIVAFDCDDTLILWNEEPDSSIDDVSFKINHKLVEELKRFKVRNQFIIVWSAGGASWAQKIVDHLNLSSYVDLVMCKPSWYYDDKEASDWMKRYFIS